MLIYCVGARISDRRVMSGTMMRRCLLIAAPQDADSPLTHRKKSNNLRPEPLLCSNYQSDVDRVN